MRPRKIKGFTPEPKPTATGGFVSIQWLKCRYPINPNVGLRIGEYAGIPIAVDPALEGNTYRLVMGNGNVVEIRGGGSDDKV